ncbi:MAG TPA: hypothetical protein VMT10_11775 [Solirubrobacteraceae bacterium]|nr:hypothetical protein [Solirubrobacteraceae bacterium]
MKATTIRWPDRAHQAIVEAAEDSGVGFSQYVRESALIRAAFDAGIQAGLRASPGFRTAQGVDLVAVREGAYAAARTWLEEQIERP